MPRDRTEKSSAITNSTIHATSQQTRFDIIQDTAPKELDLHGVNISLGKREIISDAHLKLSTGVHYVLVGRNGVGKSTLLRAIGEKVIPGVRSGLRVLLLQQSYDSEQDAQDAQLGGYQSGDSEKVIDFVVNSHRERTEMMRRYHLLQQSLENVGDPTAVVKVVRALKHEQRLRTLEQAKKSASLRSGSRGIKARKELKALEVQVVAEQERLQDIDEDTIADETGEGISMLTELETQLETMDASVAETRARSLLLGLGFTTESISQPLSSLSGGWRMRTLLASLLFQPCDILLLDEPTNFLDLPSLIWLETYLQSLTSTTILLVSHDRTFADNVAEEIMVLRDTKLERYPGNLSSYERTRSEQRQRLTRMKEAQERQKAHIEDTIAGNIRAARASGDDKKLKQAASRQKKLDDRMGYQVGLRGGRFKLNRDLTGFHLTSRDDIEVPEDEAAVKLSLPKTPVQLRFPGPLISLENVSFRYRGSATSTLKSVNLTIHEKDRVGIVGLNGAGKSTLISCLVGAPNSRGKVTSGTLSHHPRARVGYFSQTAVEQLPSDQTALQYTMAKGIINGGESPVDEHDARSALASLGLSGRTVSDLPIARLSGGQKVRLALVDILYPPPHVLVLDEVTTHLDADSVMALAEELGTYEGAVVIVSHDRWFVSAVIEGNAEVNSDEGNEGERGLSGKVYMINKGQLKEMKDGVAEFERKVRKGTVK